jgi:hypothetical protein
MVRIFDAMSTKFISEQRNVKFKVVGLLDIVNLILFVAPRRIQSTKDVCNICGNCIYSVMDFIFPTFYLLSNYYQSRYKKSLVPKSYSISDKVGLGLN